MQRSTLITHQNKGFTLIEVMLVIVVIGVLMSAVQFTFQSNQSHQQLEKAALRFAGVFELASEYGMLNNVELGLLVTEESYEFLGYDGTQWTTLADVDALAAYQLPESISLLLSLDDLPIENTLLTSAEQLLPEDESFSEQKKTVQPQVVILSGGDISPFSLSFYYRDEFEQDEVARYKVTGLYTTPLTIEGPIFDE